MSWTLIAVVGAVVILNVELSDPSAFIFGIIWFGSVLLGVTHTLRSRSIKSGQANIKKTKKALSRSVAKILWERLIDAVKDFFDPDGVEISKPKFH